MEHTELEAMKADLRRMQARIDELEATTPETPVNRRNMLRGIGAAAVGAAAGGLAFARPAAANDNDNLVIGNSTQTGNSPTVLVRNASYSASPAVGLFHVTDDISSTDTNVATTSLITAAATNNGFITAFAGHGSSYGAKLDAPVQLKLADSSNAAAPTQGGSGYTGQIRSVDGDLWMCVDHAGVFGGDATWRRITGPSEAGSYHPVTPARVYSSTFTSALGAGNRTVSVANSINVTTGVLVTSNFVPAGATAVMANVTITGTVGAGFIALNPGGNTTVTASVSNWAASGVTVANGITLALDASRQLTAVVGGAAGCSTHFIIDVFGYYI